MIHYNLQKIIKMRIFDKKEETWRPKYQKQFSFCGIKLLGEGIVGIMGSFTPISDIKTYYPNHFIENGILYEKPELRLYFGTEVCSIYFDTKQECIEKAKELMKVTGIWYYIS